MECGAFLARKPVWRDDLSTFSANFERPDDDGPQDPTCHSSQPLRHGRPQKSTPPCHFRSLGNSAALALLTQEAVYRLYQRVPSVYSSSIVRRQQPRSDSGLKRSGRQPVFLLAVLLIDHLRLGSGETRG